jgi:hypothetical protein
MFRRLTNSWELAKASAGVLRADKELVVFPLLSGLMLLLVSAAFIAPMVMAEHADRMFKGGLGYVVGFLFYLVSYFVIFFCNSALVGAALIRLRGGDPTVSDGFKVAFSRIGAIFGYAFVAATVGMVLRSLQERAGFLGRIVIGLIGMAWNLATFLVVPVLVDQNLGPVGSVKRSMELLKKTWGEQVVGNFAISSIVGLVGFVLMLVFVPIIVLAAGSGSTPAIAGAVGGLVFCLLMLMLINATLSGIYVAAVYRYASEGKVGEGFAPEMVESAFRPK